MIKGIYGYHDALNGFINIFIDNTDKVAVRGFSSAIKTAESGSLFYSNPTDYSLYKLGTFDTDTGSITLEPAPVILCRGERNDV